VVPVVYLFLDQSITAESWYYAAAGEHGSSQWLPGTTHSHLQQRHATAAQQRLL
jgi:hypothetical protein